MHRLFFVCKELSRGCRFDKVVKITTFFDT